MSPRRFVLTCALLAVVADVRGQSPARDLYGDPLPPGAVARLGTVRLRHESTIVFAAFAPSGKSILSVGSDGLVCLWDFPSGKELRRFEAHLADDGQAVPAPKAAKPLAPLDLFGEVLSMAPAAVAGASLSPDGKHLIAFCGDGFTRIWDWENAKQLGKAATSNAGEGTSYARVASGPLYAPDGKALLLVRSSRALQIIDVPTAKELSPRHGHLSAVAALAFMPDGRQLRTSDGASTRRWDAATSQELDAAAVNIKTPSDLGGAVTYKATKDIFGVVTKRVYSSPLGPTLVISPDSRFGVAVTRFRTTAEANAAKERPATLFDAATGEKRADIGIEVVNAPVHPKPVVFSPDGALLAVNAGADKEKIELYAVPSGKRLHTLETDLADPQAAAAMLGGKAIPLPAALLARTRTGQAMLFSADGKRLAFQPGPTAAIVVFDTTTGRRTHSLPAVEGSQTMQGAFTSDGRCLVLERADGTVTFFELATGKPRRTYGTKRPVPPTPPLDDPLAALVGFGVAGSNLPAAAGTCLAISPDSASLALAGPDGSVHVWDVLTGAERALVKGHARSVSALAFAPDGKTLASAGDDGAVLIWDAGKAARPAPASKPAGFERAWEALAGDDAAKAFAAMADFVAAPTDAVAWIKDHVKPAPPFDEKRTLELFEQLDAADYKARERATDDLLKLGDAVVPLLAKAQAADPPLEAKRRLDDLLGKLTNRRLQGDALRVDRAIEILERIGTPEARAVRQALTGVPR